jgi:hypothetical protein
MKMIKLSAAVRNLSLAGLASLSVGGCYYGDINGAAYASADCDTRYGDGYWSRDPYAYENGDYGYDCYDAADYHTGFVQIGFGGGWYDSLYYPGYGLFLFDRYGRRHSMSHDYLSYWGGRRAWWKHHGHRGHGWGHDRGHHRGDHGPRPGRGYGRGAAPGHDGGHHGGHDGSRGDWSNNPGAIPLPRERPRGEGRGDRPRRGGGWTPPAGSGDVPAAAAPRVPRYNVPARTSPDAGGAPAPAPRAEPAPRAAQPDRNYSPPPPPAPPRERPSMRGGNVEGGVRED